MRSPINRLMTVLAAAILCLTPLAFATAAHADAPDTGVGYAQVTQADDVDVGQARDDVGPYDEPDLGTLRDGIGPYEEPDLGMLRDDVEPYLPVSEPLAPAEPGVDTGTIVLAGLAAAAVVGIGFASVLVIRRRHHHLAHPA